MTQSSAPMPRGRSWQVELRALLASGLITLSCWFFQRRFAQPRQYLRLSDELIDRAMQQHATMLSFATRPFTTRVADVLMGVMSGPKANALAVVWFIPLWISGYLAFRLGREASHAEGGGWAAMKLSPR